MPIRARRRLFSKADIIIEYFVLNECWDVNLINETLFESGQPLIGR